MKWKFAFLPGILIPVLISLLIIQAVDRIKINVSINDKHQTEILFNSLEDAYPFKPDKEYLQLKYSGFDLSYNNEHKQANWVIYLHTKEKNAGTISRNDNFRADPNTGVNSAKLSDYKNSSYDRGHLAPAADMRWSEKAMNESFLLSNISPQLPAFNRGIWKRLEEETRKWVKKHDSIIIVTGPVLSDDLTYIGTGKVSVPEYYFKALLNISYGHNKCLAFLLQNIGSSAHLSHYAISIDSLELFSGYDFFYRMDSKTMDSLEKVVNYSDW